MTISVSSQPETLKQLIKRSFVLYRQVFVHVFFLSLMLSIVAFIPRLLAILIGQDIFNSLPLFSLSKLWLFLIDACGLFFFAAMIWRIHCVITNSHETLYDDMKISLRKLPYIFIAALLQSLLITAITFSFIVIAFYIALHEQTFLPLDLKHELISGVILTIQLVIVGYLFFAFYFYLPIILIENNGIFASLRKSVSLVRNHWWRTFRAQMTPWIVYLVCLILIRYLLKLNIHIYFTGPEEQQHLLPTCVHILIFAIFMPWVATILLVQLRDLELRKK